MNSEQKIIILVGALGFLALIGFVVAGSIAVYKEESYCRSLGYNGTGNIDFCKYCIITDAGTRSCDMQAYYFGIKHEVRG